MPGIGQELQTKAGPLPVWAWAGLGTVGLAGVLIYRKKKSMDQAANNAATNTTSSSVPGGPSNLTTQAEPMPIQMGDTFVNVAGSTETENQTTEFEPPGPDTDKDKPPVHKAPPPKHKIKLPKPPSHSLPAAPKPSGTEPKQTKRTVTVGHWPAWNGSLFGIAKHFYGNGNLWPKIWEANKGQIANPNLIHPGQVLVVP